MKTDGYVSIWLGNFSDGKALMEYAADDYVEEDDDGIETEYPSQFSKDFFDGKLWAFDPDFWERDCVEPSDDLAVLVESFSYGDTFDVSGIKLNQKYNAVILVYNYKYEQIKSPMNASVEFIASVPYGRKKEK